MIARRLVARHADFEDYERAFNGVATNQSKTLIIVMVPAFALAVALVELRRRRPFLEQLIFALHTYTALLVLSVIVDGPLIAALRLSIRLHWVRADDAADSILGAVIMLSLGTYLMLALRRCYGDRTGWAVIKALILLFAVGEILFYYRSLLFFTTYWAT
jgi:hypothetical protein